MARRRLTPSSTAAWVSTPGRPTCDPIRTAMALSGAIPATPTVVSTSAKPRRAASAASAARSAGWSRRLVTWAWLAVRFRRRIFRRACIISSTSSSPITSTSRAGVSPENRRRTSAASTSGWKSLRASSSGRQGHRLLGHRGVEGVAGDEAVDGVELAPRRGRRAPRSAPTPRGRWPAGRPGPRSGRGRPRATRGSSCRSGPAAAPARAPCGSRSPPPPWREYTCGSAGCRWSGSAPARGGAPDAPGLYRVESSSPSRRSSNA